MACVSEIKWLRLGTGPAMFLSSAMEPGNKEKVMGIIEAKGAGLVDFKKNHLLGGFELETQSLLGRSWNGLNSVTKLEKRQVIRDATSESEVNDRKRMIAWRVNDLPTIRRSRRDFLAKHQPEITRLLDGATDAYIKQCFACLDNPKQFLETDQFTTLIMVTKGEMRQQLISLERLYQRAFAKALKPITLLANPVVVDEVYEMDVPVGDVLESEGVDAQGFDVKQDGSVSGPEITTVGGVEFDELLAKSDSLFDMIAGRMSVDTRCSFHVHLSIKDAIPVYSDRFQIKLMIAVLNDNRVPDAVRQRWKDSVQLDRFFNFNLDRHKYRFVAFRTNTWEFRCFGNVSTKDQASACLQIAAESYHKALSNTQPLPLLPIGRSFQDIARCACAEGITFDEALIRMTDPTNNDDAA